jgi:Acetyltransferases, including N-acetylases of ribosomal proteins
MNLKVNLKVFDKFPLLESERLYYRNLTIRSAQDLYAMRCNDKVMEFMDAYKFTSVNEAVKLIASLNESFQNKQGINWRLVDKNSNSMIGYIGYWRLMPNHGRAEIGYALKPEFWGQGYMTEALLRIIKFGFGELKLHSIEANVNPKNHRSIRLLVNAGFMQEAYFKENFLFDGKFLDSSIFSLLEDDSLKY